MALAAEGRFVTTAPARRSTRASGARRPARSDYPYVVRASSSPRRARLPRRARTSPASHDYLTEQALLAFQGWEDLDRTGTITGPDAGRAVQGVTPRRGRSSHGAGGTSRSPRSRRRAPGEDGKVVRAVHTSTGSLGRTLRGTSTSTPSRSTRGRCPFHVWMPFAAYFRGGIAMHQSPDVPSYPRLARLRAPARGRGRPRVPLRRRRHACLRSLTPGYGVGLDGLRRRLAVWSAARARRRGARLGRRRRERRRRAARSTRRPGSSGRTSTRPTSSTSTRARRCATSRAGHRRTTATPASDSTIRSFREMDIGVPCSPRSTAASSPVQDGEFDRNFGPRAPQFDNHVVVEHGTGRFTIYGHLRKGIKLKRERQGRRRAADRLDGVERQLELAPPPLHIAGRERDRRAVRRAVQPGAERLGRPAGASDESLRARRRAGREAVHGRRRTFRTTGRSEPEHSSPGCGRFTPASSSGCSRAASACASASSGRMAPAPLIRHRAWLSPSTTGSGA